MKYAYALAAASPLALMASAQSISDSCSSFLASFDQDESIQSCTADLLQATRNFDPTSGNAGSDASRSDITSTIDNICGDTEFCSYETIKKSLSDLQDSCSDELSSGDSNVPAISMLYDTLYIAVPFHNAICARDSDDNSCLAQMIDNLDNARSSSASSSGSAATNATHDMAAVGGIGTNATTHSFASANTYSFSSLAGMAKDSGALFVQAGRAAGNMANRLVRRQAEASDSAAAPTPQTSDIGRVADDTGDQVLSDLTMPNGTTFTSTNLPFLFLSTAMSSDELCTDCTKQILAQYIGFQMKIPFAQGLSQSLLLSGQADLYNGIGAKCGDGFINDIQDTAGSVDLDGGASAVLPSAAIVLASAVAGFMLL